MNENRENMKFQITDPFIYKQVEIYKCDNCGNFLIFDQNDDEIPIPLMGFGFHHYDKMYDHN